MSSPAAGLLPCDSRQTSCNGISSITSGVQVEALTMSPVPPSYERVCSTMKESVAREQKKLRYLAGIYNTTSSGRNQQL